jgi:hypothetical protein
MKRNPVDPYGRRSKDFRTRSIPYIKKAALMNEGARVLKELFNRPYRMDMEEVYNTPSVLRVESYGRTGDGREILVGFRGEPMYGTDLMDIEVSFSVDGKVSITDEGDVFRIFSTVIDQMELFEEEYGDRISRLTFTAKGDTRSRLYSSLIRRFASKYNYIPKEINTGSKTVYFLYKDI